MRYLTLTEILELYRCINSSTIARAFSLSASFLIIFGWYWDNNSLYLSGFKQDLRTPTKKPGFLPNLGFVTKYFGKNPVSGPHESLSLAQPISLVKSDRPLLQKRELQESILVWVRVGCDAIGRSENSDRKLFVCHGRVNIVSLPI